MFLNLCNFVFWAQPGAGRELYLRVFQLHLKILLVVVSSGGDDVGVCCKIVAELFVDFIWVLVLDFTIVIKVRWWW